MGVKKIAGVALVLISVSVAFSLPGPGKARVPASPPQRRLAGGVRGGAAVKGGEKSSVSQSTLNLAKNIVGSGVLALPAGVAAFSCTKGASGPACGLIAALGAVSAWVSGVPFLLWGAAGLCCDVRSLGLVAGTASRSSGARAARPGRRRIGRRGKRS